MGSRVHGGCSLRASGQPVQVPRGSAVARRGPDPKSLVGNVARHPIPPPPLLVSGHQTGLLEAALRCLSSGGEARSSELPGSVGGRPLCDTHNSVVPVALDLIVELGVRK